MAQIVEPNLPKPCLFHAGKEVVVHQVVRVKDVALAGREHETIRNACLALCKCFQQSLVSQLDENLT